MLSDAFMMILSSGFYPLLASFGLETFGVIVDSKFETIVLPIFPDVPTLSWFTLPGCLPGSVLSCWPFRFRMLN